jgi:hypothetical protein
MVLLAATAPARGGRGPEVVVASERLAEAGPDLEKNVAAFVRRVEEVGGWPQGSLRGKGFARPREALAYIKKQRSAFAVLPPHELVEGRAALKFEILGRAVWIDGDHPAVFTTTRQPPPFEGIGSASGMRLAVTDAHDPIWLTMMFDGNLDMRVMNLVEVPTVEAAVQAVVQNRADLTLVPELEWSGTYERRTQKGGDLSWAFRSPDLPPMAVVAVGKNATPADRQKLAGALDQICKTTGAAACGGVRIQFIQSGHAESYDNVIAGYEGTRARLKKR